MSDVKGTFEDKIVHEYDGILEADNVLPLWWLFILYATVIFAAFYWVTYEVLHAQPSNLQDYQYTKARLAAEEEARLQAEGPMTGDRLIAMSKDDNVVNAGKQTFQSICAACHAQNGGGNVGPNLTDKFWIHGSKPEQILELVRKGWPEKGMPAWGPQLGERKVREAAAYVLTIRNTNVSGGKAPQGDPEG